MATDMGAVLSGGLIQSNGCASRRRVAANRDTCINCPKQQPSQRVQSRGQALRRGSKLGCWRRKPDCGRVQPHKHRTRTHRPLLRTRTGSISRLGLRWRSDTHIHGTWRRAGHLNRLIKQLGKTHGRPLSLVDNSGRIRPKCGCTRGSAHVLSHSQQAGGQDGS